MNAAKRQQCDAQTHEYMYTLIQCNALHCRGVMCRVYAHCQTSAVWCTNKSCVMRDIYIIWLHMPLTRTWICGVCDSFICATMRVRVKSCVMRDIYMIWLHMPLMRTRICGVRDSFICATMRVWCTNTWIHVYIDAVSCTSTSTHVYTDAVV